MRYKTGMVFGIFDKIEDRHSNLIKKAASICDTLNIAVSSDEEIQIVMKEKSRVHLNDRIKIITEFCKSNKIKANIIGIPNKSPADIINQFKSDIFILTKNQYQRFGKELENIIKKPEKVMQI